MTNWFINARFGMFIHYGLYSMLGRGEWVLNRERIPMDEYKALAQCFNPECFDADAICRLARRTGMRYVVFTTMHHDGFRLYDTCLSDFNSVRACGRDLVAEMVAAARQQGLRIGLYHSLNNWTDHPDGCDALEDPAMYKEFIRRTHARLDELVTKFDPVDMLWYDGWWPFDATGWQAQEMNERLRRRQPHILFNGRNGLPGDFATPEQHLSAPSPWRPWEACMTLNNSWGFHAGDHDWKSPEAVVDLLATVANERGNLLLNVGPRGNGSIPEPCLTILDAIGEWISRCGESIYDTDSFTFDLLRRGGHRSDWTSHGSFTAKGNSLYLLVRRWPGPSIVIAGVETQVSNVRLLGHDSTPTFAQRADRLIISGLPQQAPDPVCPVLKVECSAPPSIYLCGGMRTPRIEHPRYDPVRPVETSWR